MPTLRIITPLASDRTQYLPELAQSLHRAVRPEGWNITWHIEVDGKGVDQTQLNEIRNQVEKSGWKSEDVTIKEHGYQAGQSVTRSLAVYSHIEDESDWILTMDGDDILLPDALILITYLLTQHPQAKWVAGGIIKAKEDAANRNPTESDLDTRAWQGTLVEGLGDVTELVHLPPLIPAGFTPARAVMDRNEELGRMPIFGATLMYRTEVIYEAGGWPGTPTGADMALLAKVSDKWPGVVTEQPLFAYRQHPGQNTRSDWFLRNREITWRMVSLARTRPEQAHE